MTVDSTRAEPGSPVPHVINGNGKRAIALLGAGYIADWHARALRTIADVELVAICDQAAARARALAAQFGGPRVYDTLDAMLSTERLDAVHVLLPPDLHFDGARTILNAGIDVLLEKPMTARVEEATALVELAVANGRRVAVGHNFLFFPGYHRLRRDLHNGMLGKIDQLTISWHRELAQLTHGPFGIWMLRNPRNVMLEIGSHLVAQMLDLVGSPDDLRVRADNALDLPNGVKFYRRWQVAGVASDAAVALNFSFVPGFGAYTIQARGSLGSATLDFDRNTYTLMRHRPLSEDFDRYAMTLDHARQLRRQARRTLLDFALAKLHLRATGTPFGTSIRDLMAAFYTDAVLPRGITAATGAEVIRICDAIRHAAPITADRPALITSPTPTPNPHILVLGASGFIGQELTRQLIAAGRAVRVLVRDPGKLGSDLRGPGIEMQCGDLAREADLQRALAGIDCVFHLARSNVKSWVDFQRDEIELTRQIAEAALVAGVKRFIYTGTIDSYYGGPNAGTITERTPLDPQVERRNLYARAKAASERILLRMYRERGLPLVIVRPGIVIGRGGSPFHWGVGRWWYEAVCQLWGDGYNLLPLVLVEDVASGLVAAMDTPGIEGQSFNLVADPCLMAREYLDALDRSGGFQIQRHPTPILKFYLMDLFKWVVKVAVRHPDRTMPSYRDWASRTAVAKFDCTAAKVVLHWRPTSDRNELIRRGIEQPLRERLR
jgi:predicted dehydrogenase/nucleoside-diphosphate-sugar epimerase